MEIVIYALLTAAVLYIAVVLILRHFFPPDR
jgi:hypothetical protein